MAFRDEPDHIFHPKKGWVKGALPIKDGVVDHPGHRMEIDCSTGLVGYTLIPLKEIAKLKQEAVADQVARDLDATAQQSDLEMIRQEAAVNPAFAALLRRLGVA
jgi:hypothetical protein